MDNMKVNNKRLQKLILDTQKSVGQLSKLAYETGVQDGLLKANALNTLKPLDNTEMRWIPCSERLPKQENEEQRRGVYLTTNAYGYVGASKYEFCGDFGVIIARMIYGLLHGCHCQNRIRRGMDDKQRSNRYH